MKKEAALRQRLVRELRFSGRYQSKKCGLMSDGDVQMCLKLGVDILGFARNTLVPWNLSRDKTRALLRLVLPAHRSCLVTGDLQLK